MFRTPQKSRSLISKALEFSNSCGNINWNLPQNIDTCELVQSLLNSRFKLQLIVHDSVREVKSLFFKGFPNRESNKQLHLLLLNEHIFLFKDYKRFYKVKQCDTCKGIFTWGRHKICRGKFGGRLCSRCRTTHCYKLAQNSEIDHAQEAKICMHCSGYFPNEICFEFHKKAPLNSMAKTPVCLWFFHCLKCGWRIEKATAGVDILEPKTPHKCLKISCQNCKLTYDCSDGNRHFCSISKPKLKELKVSKDWLNSCNKDKEYLNCISLDKDYLSIVGKGRGICAFDIETRKTKSGRLVPYALTALFACSKCCFIDFKDPQKWPANSDCCGVRLRNYVGSQGIKDFILDLFYRKRHSSVTAFAFHGRGFDNLFILDLLLENNVIPKIQLRGRQILRLVLNGVTIKDLNCFIPGSLSKLPHSFGFANLVKKGSFPHSLADLVDNDYCSSTWPHKSL